MATYVNAKSETEEALNIVLESGTLTDRTFPGVGSGSVANIKLSIALLGYNTDDASTTTTVDDKLIWGTFGSGISSREAGNIALATEKQSDGAVLLSAAGFVNNSEALWTTVSPLLRLEDLPPSVLFSLFDKSQARVHRVFFIDDIAETEPYLSLLLPLLV